MFSISSSLVCRSLSLGLGFVLITLSGCGQKPVIDHIQIQSQIQGSSLWVEMDAQLARTAFTLPSLVLPLIDPKRPERKLGELETYPDHVIVRVDVTEALKFPIADGSKLPNGTRLPLVLNDAQIVGIPVGNAGSRVYVAVLDRQILIGAALNIRDLSPSSSAFNLFLPVRISDSISGMGGMYFGEESGVGVFALKSGMEQSPLQPQMLAKKSSWFKAFSRSRPMALDPSELTKKKIEKAEKKSNELKGIVSIH